MTSDALEIKRIGIHCLIGSFPFQFQFTMASTGAPGGTYGNANYGPFARHGSAEQVTGGRFQPTSTVFGITPPGSRSGTPPRSSTRPARSSSRRRSRDQIDESRERARSREDRRRDQAQAEEADQDQPLPTGWGARMLAAERKITTQDDQIKNLTAIVEAANATLTQRIITHENKTVEIDSRLNGMETAISERLFKTEERQALYVTMINDLTQKITTSFDQLTQRIHIIETQTASFDLWTQRIHQIEVNLSQRPNSGPAPQPTTTPTAPGAAPHFGATAAPNQTDAPNGNAAAFDIGSPLTSNVPTNPWAHYGTSGATSPTQNNDPANFDPWTSNQRGRSALQIKPFVEREWSVTDLKPSKELVSKPFTGLAEHYKLWADRIKDHFKERNSDWTFVFKLIESSKSPIWKHSLSQGTVGHSVRCSAVDFQWVTSHL